MICSPNIGPDSFRTLVLTHGAFPSICVMVRYLSIATRVAPRIGWNILMAHPLSVATRIGGYALMVRPKSVATRSATRIGMFSLMVP